MRTITLILAILLVPLLLGASGVANRIAQLEAQVAAMEEILQFVHVETEEINALAGPQWIVEGANVHVRSGSGNTFDGCVFTEPDFPNCESLTGLGNLIVGYNEDVRRFPDRSGSHNLVVGPSHNYLSFGGLVAGLRNTINGAYAAVSGGVRNTASGDFSSVSGGNGNGASGEWASVSGGLFNEASGVLSSVSGGLRRDAEDDFNWAAGGLLELE